MLTHRLRFTVVATARDEPYRYGKNGEVLVDFEERSEQYSLDGRRMVQQLEYRGMFDINSGSGHEKTAV